MPDYPSKRRPTPLIIAPDIGKLPPQAIEFEIAVLGAVLLEKNAITKVLGILKPDSFYKDAHKMIYEAAVQLFDENEPIDILTVTNKLRKNGNLGKVGGPHVISQLTSRVHNASNTEYHAGIVSQCFIARELIKLSSETTSRAYEDETDIFALIAEHEAKLIEIQNFKITNMSSADRTEKGYKAMEQAMKSEGLSGKTYGVKAIDKLTGGLQDGDLIVIGARPGNGKTSFILHMAHSQAKKGLTPIMFQQEMSEIQSSMREMAMYSGVSMQDIRTGRLSEANLYDLNNAKDAVKNSGVLIDHSSGLTISDIRAKVLKIKNIGVVYIDYLQLMELESVNRGSSDEAAIAKTTRRLKQLAKELNVPIILLSQLSRDLEKRANKRPLMSDFKGSGAIEADADVAIMLYNPSKYEENPIDDSGRPLNGKIEIIFEKNRMGSIGGVYVDWDKSTNRFKDEEAKQPSSNAPF